MALPKKSSRIQGKGVQTIAAGGSLSVNPRDDHDNLMSQFTVSNESSIANGYIIYVCGTDGLEALPVFPQTVVTLETDAPFRVTNSLANGSVNCTIGRLLLRGGASGVAGGGVSTDSQTTQSSGGQIGDPLNRFHTR